MSNKKRRMNEGNAIKIPYIPTEKKIKKEENDSS